MDGSPDVIPVVIAAVSCALVLVLAGYTVGSARRARAAGVGPSRRLLEDASNRALRTFLQGLGIDVGVAVAALLLVVTRDGEAWQGWAVVGASLARTVVQSAAAYVMRRYLDASVVPTPLPPARPGEPDVEASA